MAAQRAHLPVTGPRVRNFDDAKALTRMSQDALDGVNAAKRRAALKDPGADTSRANADRARRDGWSDGTLGGQHTPSQ